MCVLVIFVLPSFYWVGRGVIPLSLSIFMSSLKREVNCVLKNPVKGSYSFVGSIFVTIALYNFLALFPHIFSVTSHILVTLPFSYSFWLGVIVFS